METMIELIQANAAHIFDSTSKRQSSHPKVVK